MRDLITFCESLYYRFIEIKGDPWKKKIIQVIKTSIFLGSFSNRDNVRAPIQFKGKKENLTIIKSECSSKEEPFFVLIAQLFEWSIETSSLMVKGALSLKSVHTVLMSFSTNSG